MIDKEKVLTGLECCSMNGNGCKRCPYNKDCDEMPDFGNAYLCSDALELLKEQQETIVSLQSTINKLTKALAEQPEQKFFVDSDGKITPLPIQPQWISVKDDLPKERDSIFANCKHLSKHMWTKESDKVIVYVRFPDGTGTSTEGRLQDGKWWTRVSPMLEPVVTHWMPFPEPPEEVKQDADGA